jgi:hypothetical protein
LSGSYNIDLQVRESCGLAAIASFNELNNTVEDSVIDKLRNIYPVTAPSSVGKVGSFA